MSSTAKLPSQISCPICKASFNFASAVRQDYTKYSVGKFENLQPTDIYFCPECDVGIGSPILSDEQIDSLYSEGDYWKNYKVRVFHPRNDPGQFAMAEARWKFMERTIDPILEKKEISILDIGAGHGFIGTAVYESENICLRKFGVVEMDKFFRESLRRTWMQHYPDVKFECQSRIDQVADRYDCVILSHILEHINNPISLIQQSLSKLKPGGFLLIDVPYLDFRFNKNVFPHVLFYQPKTMQSMLSYLGFEILNLEICGWNYKKTPFHHGIQHPILQLLEKLFFHLRSLIPSTISKRFFSWYLGSDRRDPEGTWLRLIAKQN